MYWEYYFFRMAFFAFMLLLALGSAGIGAVTALYPAVNLYTGYRA